jgi:hypothetical protein
MNNQFNKLMLIFNTILVLQEITGLINLALNKKINFYY